MTFLLETTVLSFYLLHSWGAVQSSWSCLQYYVINCSERRQWQRKSTKTLLCLSDGRRLKKMKFIWWGSYSKKDSMIAGVSTNHSLFGQRRWINPHSNAESAIYQSRLSSRRFEIEVLNQCTFLPRDCSWSWKRRKASVALPAIQTSSYLKVWIGSLCLSTSSWSGCHFWKSCHTVFMSCSIDMRRIFLHVS